MEKLGKSLFHYMHQLDFKFSLETVCKLGIRLIQILEQIHNIGMTYNDLKLENILIGDADGSPNSLSNVRLIDFGLCTKYVDKNGYHIPFGKTAEFVGNVAMCSVNALDFNTLSRRDDLISLTYLLIMMITGRLDFVTTDAVMITQKD